MATSRLHQVRVVARIRPLSTVREQGSNVTLWEEANATPRISNASQTSPSTQSTTISATTGPQTTRRFHFDGVLGPTVTEDHVYQTTVGAAIQEHLLRGHNTTLLVYGQTGSGKTYTMEQVLPKAMLEVLQGSGTCSLSYFELYNDSLRDLLVDEATDLRLRSNGSEVVVEGLRHVLVDSMDDVELFLEEATQRRTTGSTHMNERSSRSHAICALTVELPDGSHSKLTLVDLAGSERIKKSGVEGVQKQESIQINKDLFVLGKVVSALAQQQPQHVPYRDSQLTRLLRDSLGGSAYTVLIACVSPAESNLDESLNTLRYAERARAIVNSVSKNVLKSPSLMDGAALLSENKKLRDRVEELEQQLLEKTLTAATESPLREASVQNRLKPQLSSLQRKVNAAKSEARVAKARSQAVTDTAYKWKAHIDRAKQRQKEIQGEENLDPAVDSGTESTRSLTSHSEDEDLRREIDELRRERDDLLKQRDEALEHVRSANASLQVLREQVKEVSNPLRRVSTDPADEDGGEDSPQDSPHSSEVCDESPREVTSPDDASQTTFQFDNCSPIKDDRSVQSEDLLIRNHAEKVLELAERAIESNRSFDRSITSTASSFCSRPPVTWLKDQEETVVSGVDMLDVKTGPCQCEMGFFSGKEDHYDFYLPKLGVMCTCGRNTEQRTIQPGTHPCDLINILRPWQVEFLSNEGISGAVALVLAYKEQGAHLASRLKRWRKAQGMTGTRTASCKIALHIWTKTCKVVARTVREQSARGEAVLERPAFLDVSLSSDLHSISTIGSDMLSMIDVDSVSEV